MTVVRVGDLVRVTGNWRAGDGGLPGEWRVIDIEAEDAPDELRELSFQVDNGEGSVQWVAAVEPVGDEETAAAVPGTQIYSLRTSARDETPAHYRSDSGLQPWDVIDAFGLDFYAGNALKYLLRAGKKDSAVDDLRKCRHYLDVLIERAEGAE